MEESARSDCLVTDPYAQPLIDAAKRRGWHQPIAVTPDPSMLAPTAVASQAARDYSMVRTRVFDEFLHDACEEGMSQCVVVMAGFDTRAWRYAWPGFVTVYEIDHPAILSFKSQALGANCRQPTVRYVQVGCDPRHDWQLALLDSGFDRSRNAIWLLEDWVSHSVAPTHAGLLSRLQSASRVEDWIAAESAAPGAGTTRLRGTAGVERSHVTSEGPADTASWLTENGWLTSLIHSREAMIRYGRSPSDSGDGETLDTVLVHGRRYR